MATDSLFDYAVVVQPEPERGTFAIADWVRANIPDRHKVVREDLLWRESLKDKAALLTALNGRDQAIDAYQTALDSAFYIAAAVAEGAPLAFELEAALWMCNRLRERLTQRDTQTFGGK